MKPLNFNRTYLVSGLIALGVSLATFGIFSWMQHETKTFKIQHVTAPPSASAVYTLDDAGKPIPLDFTKVADKVMDAVVNIKSTRRYQQQPTAQLNPFEDMFKNSPFQDFFHQRFYQNGPKSQERRENPFSVGQGSGVIISSDGYIVTNNHVIESADDLEVTLHDNRTYKAKVIGTDPSTDLALLQIKEENLPVLPMVNSDDVRIGEWVLAVGNPFNLSSTITAGIVSAKGRNINILKERFAVESFIQTDAAINPGNSGGALVDLNGALIGINTAIASPTGAYSGYGFAIPTNIVSKVVEDLMEFGVVQRGVLGVMIRTVDGNLAREKDLLLTNGAYVDSLLDNSAAAEAGIRPGDVIIAVDGNAVASSPQLQELIARHRPGDGVKVTVNRNGNEQSFEVVLNNRRGTTNLVKVEDKQVLDILGAELESLDQKTADQLDIKGGVKVKQLYAGKLRRATNMKEGFIITKIDGKSVNTVEELTKVLDGKKGGVMLEGVYEDIPGEYYYAFGM